MTYKITIRKTALKFIQKQERKNQGRLLKAINSLPHSGDIKKMSGYSSLYRLRVGDFRVLFEMSRMSDIITLIDITDADNRGQVYK